MMTLRSGDRTVRRQQESRVISPGMKMIHGHLKGCLQICVDLVTTYHLLIYSVDKIRENWFKF